jgi:hypothetical protein
MLKSSLRMTAGLLITCSALLASVSGQSTDKQNQSVPSQLTGAQPATAGAAPASRSTSRYRSAGMPQRARNYYQMLWGVDSFGAKSVESGEMIRFSYRVLDPAKAAQLNDKHNQPALIDEKAGVKLSVPTLEKVGALRQSTSPEAGKVYWMVFSNKERYVKSGNRISVVIGKFRVDNLLVE